MLLKSRLDLAACPDNRYLFRARKLRLWLKRDHGVAGHRTSGNANGDDKQDTMKARGRKPNAWHTDRQVTGEFACGDDGYRQLAVHSTRSRSAIWKPGSEWIFATPTVGILPREVRSDPTSLPLRHVPALSRTALSPYESQPFLVALLASSTSPNATTRTRHCRTTPVDPA